MQLSNTQMFPVHLNSVSSVNTETSIWGIRAPPFSRCNVAVVLSYSAGSAVDLD